MDKRPRRPDGSLYQSCEECKIEPDRCKGFCIFQRLEKEAEREKKRVMECDGAGNLHHVPRGKEPKHTNFVRVFHGYGRQVQSRTIH